MVRFVKIKSENFENRKTQLLLFQNLKENLLESNSGFCMKIYIATMYGFGLVLK